MSSLFQPSPSVMVADCAREQGAHPQRWPRPARGRQAGRRGVSHAVVLQNHLCVLRSLARCSCSRLACFFLSSRLCWRACGCSEHRLGHLDTLCSLSAAGPVGRPCLSAESCARLGELCLAGTRKALRNDRWPPGGSQCHLAGPARLGPGDCRASLCWPHRQAPREWASPHPTCCSYCLCGLQMGSFPWGTRLWRLSHSGCWRFP